MAIDNVAVPVRFPALNQCEITGNGLFKNVIFTAKLAHIFARCHGGAITGGRIKRRNTGPARADLFCQRPLRSKFDCQFPAQYLLLKQRVLADVRRHHFANLARFEQYPQTETIHAAVVRHDRQIFHLTASNLCNQVFRNTAQPEAARQQGHAVRQPIQRLRIAADALIQSCHSHPSR